jgi:hypothetical protein
LEDETTLQTGGEDVDNEKSIRIKTIMKIDLRLKYTRKECGRCKATLDSGLEDVDFPRFGCGRC